MQEEPTAIEIYFDVTRPVFDRRLAIFREVFLEYLKEEFPECVLPEFTGRPKSDLLLSHFSLPVGVKKGSKSEKSGKWILFSKGRKREEKYRQRDPGLFEKQIRQADISR
jgi:hypothetical protein